MVTELAEVMKRYPKYKDSGIDWLGEIPEHWEVKRIKRLSRKIIDGTHFTPNYVNNGVPFLRVTDIHSYKIDMNNIKYISQEEHEQLNKRCNPEKGDVLLSKNGTIGVTKVVDWDFPFSIFVSLCLIKLIEKHINPYFFSYVFQGKLIDEQISESSKTTSVTNLHLDKIKNLIIVVPPLSEQKTIACFIDRKLVQIDQFISNKQRFIELLKEQKSAIINRAVTKGLNPDAPMKPSGIEWLGDIPQGWEIMPLQYIVKKIGSGVTPKGGGQVYQDTGIPLLRSQNIHFDGLRLDDVAFISEEIHKSMSNSKVFPKDVLLNITGASIGRVCLVPEDFTEANVNQHVCIIRPKNTNISEYLSYFLASEFIQLVIQMSQNGCSREGLNYSQIKSFPVLIPENKEQYKIINFIRQESEKINLAITKAKQEIELIQEYRTTLISDAVTGKIDVRELTHNS